MRASAASSAMLTTRTVQVRASRAPAPRKQRSTMRGTVGGSARQVNSGRAVQTRVRPTGTQRAVPRGRQSECRLERTGEVRLVREPRVARYLHEWPLLVNPLAGELEAAHHQISVGARAEHDPELAGEVVSRQAGDRLELRRTHDARALGVEKLPRTLEAPHIDAAREGRSRGPATLTGHQSFGQADAEVVDTQGGPR